MRVFIVEIIVDQGINLPGKDNNNNAKDRDDCEIETPRNLNNHQAWVCARQLLSCRGERRVELGSACWQLDGVGAGTRRLSLRLDTCQPHHTAHCSFAGPLRTGVTRSGRNTVPAFDAVAYMKLNKYTACACFDGVKAFRLSGCAAQNR